MQRRFPLALGLFLGFAGLPAAFAGEREGDWPQWRGPDRSGVSTDTNLLDEWPESGPPIAWKAENIGLGFSTVSVADGRVLTMGMRDGAEFVIALDEKDGSELWAFQNGPGYTNQFGDGPRATPTIDGDHVYSFGASGDLSCLTVTDGKEVWKKNLLSEFGGQNIQFGMSESPLIDDDRVILSSGGAGGTMVALDKATGDLVWRSDKLTHTPGYASAVIADVDGLRQIINFTADAVVGVRADDGELLWEKKATATQYANCSTPIYRDKYVFVSSGYDTGSALLKLTKRGDKMVARQLYLKKTLQSHHGGVILIDDHIYGFSSKALTCLNFRSGKREWRARSVGKGSITAADGKLFLVGETGGIAMAEASTDEYRELGQFSIEPRQKNTWAYPVVTGGKLYIRNGDHLLVYDVRADAEPS